MNAALLCPRSVWHRAVHATWPQRARCSLQGADLVLCTGEPLRGSMGSLPRCKLLSQLACSAADGRPNPRGERELLYSHVALWLGSGSEVWVFDIEGGRFLIQLLGHEQTAAYLPPVRHKCWCVIHCCQSLPCRHGLGNELSESKRELQCLSGFRNRQLPKQQPGTRTRQA